MNIQIYQFETLVESMLEGESTGQLNALNG